MRKLAMMCMVGFAVTLLAASCNLFDRDKNPTSPLLDEEMGSLELGNALSGTGFVYPVDTRWIPPSQGGYIGFKAYNSAYRQYHLGVDFKIGYGANVYAISDGVVVDVKSVYALNAGGGIVIKHRLSNGAYFTALYGHITPLKAIGNTIKAGERIGTIANCLTVWGNLPLLHFEIHPNPNVIWTPAYTRSLSDLKGCVNPLTFLESNRPMNGGSNGTDYFAQYDNKDPIAMGCASDAITVANTNIYSGGVRIAYVEQRWSNRCGTNWGRVTRYDRRSWDTMRVEIQRSNPAKTVVEQLSGYNQIYSNMVYARSIPARTCATVRGLSACTIWR